MYNLDDLQHNLKSLIKELRDIENTIKKPIKQKKQNSQSILIKMPKAILLADICIMLTMQQIHELSNTCKTLRAVIYGPLGWKILLRIKTPYPIQVITPKSELQIKFKKVAAEGSDFYVDDTQDEKYIYRQRLKFKKLLMIKFADYQKSKEKYQAHKQKVRIESNQIFKMKQQYIFFEEIKRRLQVENDAHKDKLKKISEGFQIKIKQMDMETDELLKERTKLQNQKQALASKVRDYQNQIKIIKEESEQSKNILKRIKSYIVDNEL